MRKSKLLILGLVSCLSVLGFTSAQFYNVSTYTCAPGVNNSPDYDTFCNFYNLVPQGENFSFEIVSTKGGLGIGFYNGTKSVYTNPYFTAPYSSSVNSFCSSRGLSDGCINGLRIFHSNGTVVLTVKQELSSMPVSEFTPVITGLTNSINEFIPYVVYISLGVLGVIIGFFAIKRLMRYVKGSTLSVFSSRKKRK